MLETNVNLFLIVTVSIATFAGGGLVVYLFFSDGPVWGVDESLVKPKDDSDD